MNQESRQLGSPENIINQLENSTDYGLGSKDRKMADFERLVDDNDGLDEQIHTAREGEDHLAEGDLSASMF